MAARTSYEKIASSFSTCRPTVIALNRAAVDGGCSQPLRRGFYGAIVYLLSLGR